MNRSYRTVMKGIAIIACLAIQSVALGQSSGVIKTEIDVDIIPYSMEKSHVVNFVYPNMLHIIQTFEMKDYVGDSICLHIDKPSSFAFLNSLYFQKIAVNAIMGTKKTAIPFTFKPDGVHFATPCRNCTIELTYFFQPDDLMPSGEENCMAMLRAQQAQFSWYFSMPNMKISKLTFTVPNSVYFFANLPQQKNQGKIELNCDAIASSPIAFCVLEKKYYEKIPLEIPAQDVNLYLYKGVMTPGDTSDSFNTYYTPANRITPALVAAHKEYVKKALKNMQDMFKKQKDMDVIEGPLIIAQNGRKVAWGGGFNVSSKKGYVVMDTIFWDDHLGLHEMVHLYNTIVPEESDSSHYFFHESMTEYLATIFEYDSKEQRDSIYDTKMLKYISQKQDYTSILQVNKNTLTMEMGGTYGIVYLKTPYIIHSFAKKIGEDKFIKILSNYFKQISNKKNITMRDFEICLKANGVTDEQWNWFMKYL